MTLFQQAAGLLSGMLADGFEYNRDNFLYDREQRQLMEYQLADMRIKQVGLWRQDVRDSIELAPKKMQVYLLVIALELNAVAVALCKARVPPGVPSWLAACHTLAACSALTYLLMGLWFGLQAFVSAQAYKVRILTQLVRLPVPTWQALEGSRTYASSFETVKTGQMLRVPFVLGTQESRLPPVREQAEAAPALGPGVGPEQGGSEAPSDPWGLERSAEGFAELRPEVNQQVEKQRHVWLIREAARFYQTYDAFCRISLSAGTSSLAQFFAFFCLTYVLTENAAPIAAWAGMFVFSATSIMFMRIDLLLHGSQYLMGIILLIISPVLCGVVTFISSKRQGDPGKWEFLMPAALFLRGAWFIYYLWLFRVREIQNAAMLPMAFKAVLFIDPFAWAKHSGTWFRQLRQSVIWRRSTAGFPVGGRPSPPTSGLPSTQCVDAANPRRPEEVVGAASGPIGDVGAHVSFRPRTFAGPAEDTEEESRETGADIHGEKPGLVPWRYFFLNTFFIALMWWTAATVALVNALKGTAVFTEANYGLAPGQVAPMPMLIGVKVETAWHSPLVRPRGLACDPHGQRFATVGRVSDGRHAILHGRLPAAGQAVRFAEAPRCEVLEGGRQQVQDLTLHECGQPGGCSALVLPRFGNSLVSCPLGAPELLQRGVGQPPANVSRQLKAAHLARAWLEDRGGAPLDGRAPPGGFLEPEDIASLAAVPCGAGLSGAPCAVVGTTARRVVQLVSRGREGQGQEWVPKRLVRKDHGEVPGPGAFALLGGRYLATLHRAGSHVRVTDLSEGGRSMSSWSLPSVAEGEERRWASICSGGNSLFALEDRENPSLWRFSVPGSLQEH